LDVLASAAPAVPGKARRRRGLPSREEEQRSMARRA